MATSLVLFVFGAYFLGSISSAILVTRIFFQEEIRDQGSKNPGATNVLRVAGKSAAACVFLFDVLKGLLPVYAGFLYGFSPLQLSLIAIFACVGHMFPLFFHFKGGKAVATALGAMLPIDWWLSALLLSTWLIVFGLTRISSLAAIITLTLTPIYTYIIKPEFSMAVSLLCIMILFRHKQNITRLLARQENKVRSRTKK